MRMGHPLQRHFWVPPLGYGALVQWLAWYSHTGRGLYCRITCIRVLWNKPGLIGEAAEPSSWPSEFVGTFQKGMCRGLPWIDSLQETFCHYYPTTSLSRHIGELLQKLHSFTFRGGKSQGFCVTETTAQGVKIKATDGEMQMENKCEGITSTVSADVTNPLLIWDWVIHCTVVHVHCLRRIGRISHLLYRWRTGRLYCENDSLTEKKH